MLILRGRAPTHLIHALDDRRVLPTVRQRHLHQAGVGRHKVEVRELKLA